MEGCGSMGVTVSVKGGDKWKKALKGVAQVGAYVQAGVLKGSTQAGGSSVPVAQYAFWNEFGAPNAKIPPRPFLRNTAKTQADKWIGIIVNRVKGNATKRDVWIDALRLCGLQMASDIRYEIENGSFMPNAQRTIDAKRRKGKTDPEHPLIDTGHLIASISSKVVRK